jgi:hypothetical protein
MVVDKATEVASYSTNDWTASWDIFSINSYA